MGNLEERVFKRFFGSHPLARVQSKELQEEVEAFVRDARQNLGILLFEKFSTDSREDFPKRHVVRHGRNIGIPGNV